MLRVTLNNNSGQIFKKIFPFNALLGLLFFDSFIHRYLLELCCKDMLWPHLEFNGVVPSYYCCNFYEASLDESPVHKCISSIGSNKRSLVVYSLALRYMEKQIIMGGSHSPPSPLPPPHHQSKHTSSNNISY